MQEAPYEQHGSVWKTPYARQEFMNTATSAFIGGALMLLVSFMMVYTTEQDTAILSAAAVCFNWTMRFGGFAMLLAALLCYLNLPWAILYDAVLTGLAGLALVFSGSVMLLSGFTFEGLLLLIFSVMFFFSARSSWNAHQRIVNIGKDPEVMMGMLDASGMQQTPSIDADQAAARAEALKRIVSQKEDARATERSPSQRSRAESTREPSASAPANVDVSKVNEDKEPPPSGFLADLGKDES